MIRALLFLVAVACSQVGALAQRGTTAAVPSTRFVAVGDIHGAYEQFVALLQRAGLIDQKLRWSGGRTILVQTGDYTDRGTDVRKVLDLLMRLEREARSAGGQVVVLLGNHEVMNLIGDWRDVTPEICATFADARSEQRREQAWTQYMRLLEARAKSAGQAAPLPAREAWMAEFPPGCLEYREAMSPRGTYGRWLRDKPIAAVVNATLFMHAGINPQRPAPKSVDEVVARARDEIKRLDAYRQLLTSRKLALPFFSLQDLLDVSAQQLRAADAAIVAAKAAGTPLAEIGLDVAVLREAQEMINLATWSLVDPQGPLWYRGYATAPEDTTAADVTALREHLKLSRIVVGHTPTPDRRIAVRYAGTVLVIDTGMLTQAYKGNPAMLDLSGGRLKAIYLDGDVELTVKPKAAASEPPRGVVSNTRASNPVALATAKLAPFRLRSGDTPGIGRG